MKTFIVGAGGVGGYYGGLLAKAGNDVTFLARGDHAKAMRASGLDVKSSSGHFLIKPVKVISSFEEIEAPELILVCVKSYDIESIARQLSSKVSDSTLIIPLQNGIDSEHTIRKYILNAIVAPGITWVISKRSAPGMIEQTGNLGTVMFGERSGQNQDLLKQVERLMRSAGIDAKYVEDIERELWLKYLWILGFAGMSSLCRTSIGVIAGDPEARSLYRRCLREAFSVANHLKVNVSDNDYEKFIQRIDMLAQTNPSAKTSMLVDIENNRNTEIESLHGRLCQLAKQCGIDVPINETIYATVKLTHPLTVPVG